MHAITDAKDFSAKVLKAKGFVMVDFWSPTCGPCEMLNTLLEGLEKDLKDTTIVKVNVDDLVALADAYRVIVMPTIKVFKNGECLKDIFGVQPPENLHKILEDLRAEN